MTPDKTGWHVEYEISALVTPAITDQMRNDLKQQVIARVNSGEAFTAQPASIPAAAAQQSAYVQPQPVPQSSYNQNETLQIIEENKKASKKQARKDTERELEEIRELAAVKAQKKEAVAAKEEIDSRKIMILTF